MAKSKKQERPKQELSSIQELPIQELPIQELPIQERQNYILNTNDISKILGLSIRVVRLYLSKGKIKSKKVGKKYFVLYSDLVSFISA